MELFETLYDILNLLSRRFGNQSMKINEENFRKNFPADMEPPEELIRLLTFQEDNFHITKTREYSGHFYLDVGPWDDPPFIDVNVLSKLIPFGSDADGSVYSFWKYKNFSLCNCPIVFTGAIWWGNTILANSLYEFLSLLSLGVDELGYAVHYPPDWLDHISDDIETRKFRDWLYSNFKIDVPSNPLEIVEKARNSNPDFGKWIEKVSGLPPEKSKKPPW